MQATTPGVDYNAGATSMDGAGSLQEELQALHAIQSVTVSRSDRDSSGGYVWFVTFTGVDGNLDALTISQASGNPVVSTNGIVELSVCDSALDAQNCTDGSEVTGHFWISIDGGNSSAVVPANASSGEFEQVF